MNTTLIQDFLSEEYSQSALYSSFRSIASYVDGLKPASRKVIHTVKEKNITTDTKVSRLAASVSEFTEYLHGEASLQSVISNMAQDFVGSNNDNLLNPSGSFGTRFVPTPSAPRYIFTRKSNSFDFYFRKEDDDILKTQEFEGVTIEPQFFVPALPLILINGSEGIGTGFAQKILPRNITDVMNSVSLYLEGKRFPTRMVPYFRGFKGKVSAGDSSNSWVIEGVFSVTGRNTVEITEIPIGYTLSSYLRVLDSLEENKIIKGYEDKSENDSFRFILNVTREFTDLSLEEIRDTLKLSKKVTENFTVIDENNAIREFSSERDILLAYLEIRTEYYALRKESLLRSIEQDIVVLSNKAKFLKAIIDGRLHVLNKPKKEVEAQISNLDGDLKIDRIEDSFDYLLNLSIYNLTKERYEQTLKEVKSKEEERDELLSKSEKDLWLDDLKLFKKSIDKK